MVYSVGMEQNNMMRTFETATGAEQFIESNPEVIRFVDWTKNTVSTYESVATLNQKIDEAIAMLEIPSHKAYIQDIRTHINGSPEWLEYVLLSVIPSMNVEPSDHGNLFFGF
jgi:hypothetical protein